MSDYKTWPINKWITCMDDGGAFTFDMGESSLSLLPADVPKVHGALTEWMADRAYPK